MESLVFAVVMAGGKGERFWPLSREKRPKQMLNLFGEMSLIEQTVMRLQLLLPLERILIVTNRKLCGADPESSASAPRAKRHRRADGPRYRSVCRSRRGHRQGQGGLPGCGDAASPVRPLHRECQCSDPRSSDRLRADPYFGFHRHHRHQTGFPESGLRLYRMRRAHRRHRGVPGAPIPVRISIFCGSGNFLWNSGMFAWRVSTILSEWKRTLRNWRSLRNIFPTAADRADFSELLRREYENAPKISIDYAVMEKSIEYSGHFRHLRLG